MIKLRELADRHFDLNQTNYLVVGGDGATRVKHSFDLLNLPQFPWCWIVSTLLALFILPSAN